MVALALTLLGCGRAPQSAPGLRIGPLSNLVGPDHTLAQAVGLETLGGTFTALLPLCCATPCSKTETFSTAQDNQEQITITVYRGHSDKARDNEQVGVFQVYGIPPAARGVPNVAITFVVSPEGVLTLRAEDGATRKPMALRRLTPKPRSGAGA